MQKLGPKLSELEMLGYDRRLDIYRQVAKENYAASSGIERMAYMLFGVELMSSLAFALDPFKQFRFQPRRVSLLSDGPPTIRTKRFVVSPSIPRIEKWTEIVNQYGYARNPQLGLFDYYYYGPRTTVTKATVDRGAQQALTGELRDSTRKTRPKGFTGGEFELFVPKILSNSRHHGFTHEDNLVTNNIGTGQRTQTIRYVASSLYGPEFAVPNSFFTPIKAACAARANVAIQRNVLGMLENVQPSHRRFELFYQIAELRDLPRTVRSTLDLWHEFEKRVGTDVFRLLLQDPRNWVDPDVLDHYIRILGRRNNFQDNPTADLAQRMGSAFLNYKFGWESFIKGLVQLFPSVTRAVTDVNRIIERMGLDTTFRTKIDWVEESDSVPNIFASNYRRELNLPGATYQISGVRECELRLAANFAVNFPHAEHPRFRMQLFLRKLGVYPTPSDLYNLIPWTWLIDWWTGLSDYIEILDTIRRDESLVNYAFITYKEVNKVDMSIMKQFITSRLRSINGVQANSQEIEKFSHNGQFSITYQLRRSVPSVSLVKAYSDPDLGGTRGAILGALLASKGHNIVH